MGYVNDPRKNIHSIYTKEMINPFIFSKPAPAILKDSNTVCWWDFTDVSKVVKDSTDNPSRTWYFKNKFPINVVILSEKPGLKRPLNAVAVPGAPLYITAE